MTRSDPACMLLRAPGAVSGSALECVALLTTHRRDVERIIRSRHILDRLLGPGNAPTRSRRRLPGGLTSRFAGGGADSALWAEGKPKRGVVVVLPGPAPELVPELVEFSESRADMVTARVVDDELEVSLLVPRIGRGASSDSSTARPGMGSRPQRRRVCSSCFGLTLLVKPAAA